MAKDLKHSLTIAGHRTSLSLEPEFWTALQKAAARRNLTIAGLVSEIDQSRGRPQPVQRHSRLDPQCGDDRPIVTASRMAAAR